MAAVALLGAGRMGSAMVRRLVVEGHRVAVWNRSASSVAVLASELADHGMTVAESPAAAVAEAEVVLATLADGTVTQAVLLDPVLLAALPAGAVVCDLATSGVVAAREIAARYGDAGRAFVDAPVSGSVASVEAGELLVMASGAPDAVDRARPVLAALARRIVHIGEAGAGQAMKLAVNLVVHDLNAAVSEGLLLAARAGVPPDVAYGVFEESVISAPYVRYKRSAFLDPAAPVAMALDLVRKDLRLVAELAHHVGAPISATEAVTAQVAAACEAGWGARDMASITRYLDETTHPD